MPERSRTGCVGAVPLPAWIFTPFSGEQEIPPARACNTREVNGRPTTGRLSAASRHRRRRRRLATERPPGAARGRCIRQASGLGRSCSPRGAALLVP